MAIYSYRSSNYGQSMKMKVTILQALLIEVLDKQILFDALLLKMPLYSNIKGRTAVYWLANIGVGSIAGPKYMYNHPNVYCF